MGKGLKEQVEGLERRLILDALKKTQGIQVLAAKELGISERVLRYKMRKYRLKVNTHGQARGYLSSEQCER